MAKSKKTKKKPVKKMYRTSAKATAYYILVRDTSPTLFAAIGKTAKSKDMSKSALIRSILAQSLKKSGALKNISRWV